MVAWTLGMIGVGVVMGCFTGMTPGIHTNLLASSLLVAWEKVGTGSISPLEMGVLIFSMALTHTFVSFIPSTFLGVPDTDTVLSLYPSHQYMREGRGHEAILLTVMGSLYSLLLTVLTIPLWMLVIKVVYPFIKAHMSLILILIAGVVMAREKERFFAGYAFLAAGILGVYTLNLSAIENPLMPLLTGLFGMPPLMSSLFGKSQQVQQRISFPKIERKRGIKAIMTAVVTGSFFSFLPSVGPSQAAVFSSLAIKERSREVFLMVVGSLNTVNMMASIITLYMIQKARNGAVVAIAAIIPEVEKMTIILLIAVALVTSFPATMMTIVLSKKCAVIITRVKYKQISAAMIVLLVVMSMIISGPLSSIVLVTATAIGFIPILKEVSRNMLMGSLMVPTIMWYMA